MNNNPFSNNQNTNPNQNSDIPKNNLDYEIGNFLKADYCEIETDQTIIKKSLYSVLFYAAMFLILGSFVIVILQQFYISTHNITEAMLKPEYIHYDKITSEITNFSSAYGNFFIYLISLIVVVLLMHPSIKKDLIQTRKMGVGTVLKYCLIGYFIFMACSFIGNILITIIGSILNISAESGNEQGIIDIMTSGTGNLIIMSVATVVLAPFLEETIFRKGLFNLLSKKLKPIWVIIISGLIFGSIHIIDPVILEIMNLAKGGSVKSLIYEFSYIFVYGIMGIAFGLVYQLSHRNMVVTVILHMINNFISVLFTIAEIYNFV